METTNNSKKTILISVGILIILGFVFWYMNDRQGVSNEINQSIALPEYTQEERRAAVAEILKKAEETMTIDVSACKPFPEVAQFTMGSTVEFKNNDSVEHVIFFDPLHKFVVPAKGSFKLTFDFYEYPGVRKYTCDSFSAGSIVVIR